MKTKIFFAILLFAIPAIAHAQDAPATPYSTTFVVSGYYSPLPNQARYVRGSYEADLRLNGSGVRSADRTPVYVGMLAAPATIEFGTKIFIPGIGIGTVHDRGGAIQGNRIDVWMGFGEPGMARALAWGLKTVEATVFGSDPSVSENVNLDALPQAPNAGLAVAIQTKYFTKDLGPGVQGQDVRELQRLLNEVGGFYTGQRSGAYDEETRSAVERFQFYVSVIQSSNESGAGFFGPKTRIAFERLLDEKIAAEMGRVPQVVIQAGVVGESVTQLQGLLQDYSPYRPTKIEAGAFDDETRESLKQLQIKYGVVASVQEFGAGFYGPKTQDLFRSIITKRFEPSFSLDAGSDQRDAGSAPPPPVAQSDQLPPAFPKTLVLNDVGEDVRELQQELKNLNFFGLEPTGYYGDTTRHALFKFQQAFGIVDDAETQGAGVFGPQTREKINALIADRRASQASSLARHTQQEIVASRIEDERVLVASTAQLLDTFPDDLSPGSRGVHVVQLQRVLQKLGFFKAKLTSEYYGKSTAEAVRAFQQSHGITPSGALDFSTRRKLNEIIGSTKTG